MIKSLYFWGLEKVSGRQGERWLAALSFAESSFFPIPPDVLLLPMILAERKRAWRLAFITTFFSVAGAILGYIIGAFMYEAVAQPLMAFYGYEDKFESFEALYNQYGILIVLIGGLTPVPFKVITIASGLFSLNPLLFILSTIPARAPRFYLEAALLWRFGEPIHAFVEKRLSLLITLAVIVVVLGYVALKWI